MKPSNNKKIALAHDFLTVWGGAERVFQVMADMYPEAPIYTLFYDEALAGERFPGREIRTSFLQKFPKWLRESNWLLPLYPVAVETLDLRNFDIVLSSSGAWMKGLVTRLYTKHVSYLHSPMRYVWDTYHEHPGLTSGFKFWKRLFMSYLRLWDKEAADRPDMLLVNSDYTQKRVAKYYRRESQVIYPPLTLQCSPRTVVASDARESEAHEHLEPGAHRTDASTEAHRDTKESAQRPFVVVARLTASKHIDVVIQAFNKLGLPLEIVGTGKAESYLRSLAGKNIVFRGALTDRELEAVYVRARALIQPSEEDFGLVALEALSCGVPVIAYRGGAIEEIVTPGTTGELFDDLVPESLAGTRKIGYADRKRNSTTT